MHCAGLQLLHGEKDGQRAKRKRKKKKLEFLKLGSLHPLIFFLSLSLTLLPSGILNRAQCVTDYTISDHSSYRVFLVIPSPDG